MCKLEVSSRDNIFGDNIAYAKMYDFSRGNMSMENRINNITLVASICYQSPKAFGSESLYNRLKAESHGLPSSSFEFIPVLLSYAEFMEKGWSVVWTNKLKEGETEVKEGFQLEMEKFGCWIEDGQYLLTNYRAVLMDQEKYDVDFVERYNTEIECDIIKKHYKVFNFKVDFPTRSQMVRSRVNLQELCVSGETNIYTSQGNRTIEDLYKIQESQKEKYGIVKYPSVKTYDFNKKVFTMAKIKEVFKTGKKEVYELTLQWGHKGNEFKIKSTLDHKFYTKEGWKPLKDIKVGDFMAKNGEPFYRDKLALKKMKEEFLARGIGLKGMSMELKVNYNTLKAWIHKHKLQYTQKEASSTFNVWNKNVRGRLSHSFGQVKSLEARLKIANRHVMPLGTTKQGFFKRARSYWEADFRRKWVLEKCNHKCMKCGRTDHLEYDHIQPVSIYPEKAFDLDNMQTLCTVCHAVKSIMELKISRSTLSFGFVKAIEKIGVEETYDLEVDHPDHNYVANDIVTHNSRRYVSAKRVEQDHYISRKMSKVISKFTITKPFRETYDGNDDLTGFAGVPMGTLVENIEMSFNTQQVIDICMNHYFKALEDGVKPEEARRIIPQTGYSQLWMGFLPYQLENFFKLRLDSHAQWEIRKCAEAMKDMIESEVV